MTPSSSTPAFNHFRIRRMMRRSPTRCSTKRTSHSWLTSSKGSNVRVENEVHLLACDSNAECIQRIVLATPRSKPIAEPKELLLVDAVQHLDGSPLDQLVFQGGHRKWALAAVGLRYIRPARRQCPVCSPLDPRSQISEF